MRFLVDAQLPVALARWLTSKGHVAEHVSDHDMSSASDSEIWEFAVATSAVIITKDEDFAQRRILVGVGPTIIWIRLGNSRTRPLLTWFEAAFERVMLALERGETLIELA
jgi:predicted nuclease of predicted toxin-antitoxin system